MKQTFKLREKHDIIKLLSSTLRKEIGRIINERRIKERLSMEDFCRKYHIRSSAIRAISEGKHIAWSKLYYVLQMLEVDLLFDVNIESQIIAGVKEDFDVDRYVNDVIGKP